MCRYQLGLVSHRTPPSLGSSRPSGACSPYKCFLQPIGRLYWENSGLSEISTQTLGNVNIHWFWGGVRGTPVIDVRGV